MPTLTPEARDAWQNRESRMVFTTVDAQGVPNSIWILCAELVDDETFVIANNSMNKSLENIEAGCTASLLFIAPEREAYQVKGTVRNHTSGPVYDDMKSRLNPNYPGRSAITLTIEEVFYGPEKVA